MKRGARKELIDASGSRFHFAYANSAFCSFIKKGLSSLGKDAACIATDLKSAKWKIMLAALLKQKSSATNIWIAGQLRMGTPDAVSRYVSGGRKRGQSIKIKDTKNRVPETCVGSAAPRMFERILRP